MRLEYAFLADAAQYTPADGRLWVLGGDFDTLTANDFPVTNPSLTLIVKVLVQPTECGREHHLRVEFINSNGVRMQSKIEAGFVPQPNVLFPDREVGIGIALNLQSLIFPVAGDYAFHIFVDDLELRALPIHLTLQERA